MKIDSNMSPINPNIDPDKIGTTHLLCHVPIAGPEVTSSCYSGGADYSGINDPTAIRPSGIIQLRSRQTQNKVISAMQYHKSTTSNHFVPQTLISSSPPRYPVTRRLPSSQFPSAPPTSYHPPPTSPSQTLPSRSNKELPLYSRVSPRYLSRPTTSLRVLQSNEPYTGKKKGAIPRPIPSSPSVPSKSTKSPLNLKDNPHRKRSRSPVNRNSSISRAPNPRAPTVKTSIVRISNTKTPITKNPNTKTLTSKISSAKLLSRQKNKLPTTKTQTSANMEVSCILDIKIRNCMYKREN